MKKENPGLFEFITRKIDGYLLAYEIKDFVLKKYGIVNQKEALEVSSSEEFNQIYKNLKKLGWARGTESSQIKDLFNDNKILTDATQWADSLENGKVIKDGFISDKTGFFLDILDDKGVSKRGFTAESNESLLKYVEVNRKKILAEILKSCDTESSFVKWISVSTLFCRTSRRHKDLRFLNAALKLNDMFFPKMKNQNKGKPLLNFLIALTEQEISTMELL